MNKKNVLIFAISIFTLLILFNFNNVNAATSGDYSYDIKSDGTISITGYTGSGNNISIPSYIDGKKVTELGEKAFAKLNAETVTIPNTVTKLNYGVFYNSNLKSVTIPSSVTEMGSSAFIYNFYLETAVINASIDTLPNATFMNCYQLKNVTLSSNIKKLDMQSFVNCTSLTDLSFLTSIEQIGQQAFMYCSSLSNVVIPKSVINIGYQAFDSSVNLDLSKTRLIKFNEYYAVGTEITLEGTYNYDRAYEVLEIVNNEREYNGLSTLMMDEDLMSTAMIRAVEISTFFSHTRPTGLQCFSASEKMRGENIAMGYTTSENVMIGWMNSQGHRKNILTEGYTTIGVGCFCKDGIYYWVQCFGTNSIDKDATKPANSTGEKRIYVGDEYVNLDTNISSKTIKPNEGFSVTITNNSKKCNANCATWTSSNNKVATVDSNGNIKGIKNGTAIITVTLGNNVKTITVYVQKFDDVNVNKWYTDAVNYCYTNNIMLGTSSTTFEPNTKLTRGMLVTILYRMEGAPAVTAANKFTDVESSKYYYNAVKWASSKGIVNGYAGTKKFGPDDAVTRQDLAVVLSAYCNYKGKYVKSNYGLSSYSDSSKISSYALPAMRWAVKNKIINGSNVTLNPKGTATRAEAACMLYSYLTNIK